MDNTRRWIFHGAVIVGFAALVAILLFRANPPEQTREAARPKIAYTSGRFVEGPLEIPAGGYLKFNFNLNRRSRMLGRFFTNKKKQNIDCFVLDEKNFTAFNEGAEYTRLTGTGYIPGGQFDRRVEPGNYFVIFDNRAGSDRVEVEIADFSVE